MDTLDRCWKYGRINVAPLDPSGNYHRLAEYLLKETEGNLLGRTEVPASGGASCSRSIVDPGNPQGKNIERASMAKKSNRRRRMSVDEDTVRMYEHAIFGVECRGSACLISLDGPAKGKRGEPIQRPEKVYQTDKQLSMEEMAF